MAVASWGVRQSGRMAGMFAIAAMLFFLARTGATAQESSPIPWPDGQPHIALDLFVGAPLNPADTFTNPFPGASLRFFASSNIEFGIDYIFLGTDYYYPESPSGSWQGPVEWSSMPAGFRSQSDWIFYQTRHFISPMVWYVVPPSPDALPFAVRLGLGPALSFVVPSGAADYYPGLSQSFSQFSSGFKAFLGASLAMGVEFRLGSVATLGAQCRMVVDSFTTMVDDIGRLGLSWLGEAGIITASAGLRL